MNWASVIAGAVIVALILVPLHEWDVYHIETVNAQKIKDQVTFDIKKCEADKKITEGQNDDLKGKIIDLGDQLAAAKLRIGTRCIVPVTKSTGQCNGANSDSKLSRSNVGVTSDALLDFAADCQREHLYLFSLRQFDILTWKANNQ